MNRLILACCLALTASTSGAAPAAAQGGSAAIAAAIAAPLRPAADTARDGDRKPAALLTFAEVMPGQRIGDLLPGGGYFTRLFSAVAGAKGHIYAIIPAELLVKMAKAADPVDALAAQPGYANVSVIKAPLATLAPPVPLDVVWTSQNYHDVYGFFGADAAAAMDATVYRMLRPGGLFIVVDHAALPGASATAPTTLHRIDRATVKAQVIAAGFVFAGSSNVLANPADAHDLKVFDPAIRGHTDQFVMKFRKPG